VEPHLNTMKRTSELTLALVCTAFLAGLEASVASTVRVEYDAYKVQEDRPFVQVAVVREGDLTAGASVDYATSDQTATAGEDYKAVGDTLTFMPGDTSQTFAVPIINDPADENEFAELAKKNWPKFYKTIGRGDAQRGEQIVQEAAKIAKGEMKTFSDNLLLK